MKRIISTICLLLNLVFLVQAQEKEEFLGFTEEEKLALKNDKAEVVYGNLDIKVTAFYMQDTTKYIYSKKAKRVYILGKANIILATHKVKNKEFTLPFFVPFDSSKVMLQSYGDEKKYWIFDGLEVEQIDREIPKKAQVKSLNLPNGTLVEAHHYSTNTEQWISKVLLFHKENKTDTLYVDVSTEGRLSHYFYQRMELIYTNQKIYFFNADQKELLVLNEAGEKLFFMDLKEHITFSEDMYVRGDVNFYLDKKRDKMYVVYKELLSAEAISPIKTAIKTKTHLIEIDFETKQISNTFTPPVLYWVNQIKYGEVYFNNKESYVVKSKLKKEAN